MSQHSSAWKTTVFSKDLNEEERVLKAVLHVLSEEFSPDCLTGTTPRLRKVLYLDSYPGEERQGSVNQELGRQLQMSLKRVVILCNGTKPVVLFRRS